MLKNAALLIFFTIFVGVIVYLVTAKRGKYDRAARLALDDGPETTTDGERERGPHGS